MVNLQLPIRERKYYCAIHVGAHLIMATVTSILIFKFNTEKRGNCPGEILYIVQCLQVLLPRLDELDAKGVGNTLH